MTSSTHPKILAYSFAGKPLAIDSILISLGKAFGIATGLVIGLGVGIVGTVSYSMNVSSVRIS